MNSAELLECPICYLTISIIEDHTTKCGHHFHHDCITAWLSNPGKNNCPLCRTVIREDNSVNKSIVNDVLMTAINQLTLANRFNDDERNDLNQTMRDMINNLNNMNLLPNYMDTTNLDMGVLINMFNYLGDNFDNMYERINSNNSNSNNSIITTITIIIIIIITSNNNSNSSNNDRLSMLIADVNIDDELGILREDTD